MSSTLAFVLVDITPRPLTLEEYFAVVLPEGVHSELVEGQVVVNASPVGPHQRLVVRLAFLTEAPLLVVEVLSPDSFERDVLVKRGQYARAGLNHYWVARPDTGEIVRYGRSGDSLVEAGRLVAGRVHAVDEPFSIELDPATLLGRRP